MGKRIIALLLTVIMVIGFTPLHAYSAEITGEGYSFDSVSKTLTIASNGGTTNWETDPGIDRGSVKKLVIENSVTAIPASAFQRLPLLISVTIPDSVISMGDWAFESDFGLVAVTFLGSTAPSLGQGVFSSCKNGFRIYYPDGGTGYDSLGYTAYSAPVVGYGYSFVPETGRLTISSNSGTSGWGSANRIPRNIVTSLVIEEGVTSIGESAFETCSSLREVDLPDSLTSLGMYAFSGAALTEITIPDGVTVIPNSAFYGCSSLSSVTIPDGVTSIEDFAFTFCPLTALNLPQNLTSIGSRAFMGCRSIATLTIPDTVTNIGAGAFSGCISLQEVTIPAGITSIGNQAFSSGTSLASATFIGMSAPTFGTSVFAACQAGFTIYYPAGGTGYDSLGYTAVPIADSMSPAAPVILSPVDGSTISTNLPTFTGMAEVGSTVAVFLDEISAGTTTVDAAGNWSFTPVAALTDGTHNLKATAKDAAENVSEDSNVCTFTVDTEPVTVTSVTVKTAPDKTTYTAGEVLDLTGLVVTLHKSNSTTEDAAFVEFGIKGITVSPANGTVLSSADTAVTITYTADNKSVNQAITVNPASEPVTVTSVTVKTAPAKTTYTEGESLDLSGLVVILHKSDSTTEEAAFAEFGTKGITVSPANGTALSSADTAVTITYTADSKSVNQGITVTPTPAEDSDAAISLTSVNYNQNEPADVSTTITWNSASTVTEVVYGITSLTTPEGYVVTGSAITIRSSYLETLGLEKGDKAEFEISFDKGNSVIFTVNIVDSSDTTPVSHSITVENDGHGTTNASPASALAGTEIILAATPNDGYHFKDWQVISPIGLTIVENIFIMPDEAVTVKAIFEENSVTSYTLTVNGSYASESGAGSYVEGVTVSINAGSRSNYTFSGWSSSDGVTFANPNNAATTFTMPARNVNVTAAWSYNGGGGGSTGGGGSSSSTPTYKADIVAGNGSKTALPVTVNKNTGSAFLDVSSQGSLTSGENVITLPSISDVDTYSVGIPVPSLSTPDRQGILTVNTGTGVLTVPSNMLTGVSGASGNKAEITIGQGDKASLPVDVKAAVGNRPLVQLTLSVDGERTDWNNPYAPVTVSIPYTPTAAELANPESIVIWYIDGSGNAVSVPNGHYDPATGTVTFFTTHFSHYAVAYVPKTFSDLAGVEWARKAIEVMASKGIISGTGKDVFSPSANITRADYMVLLVNTLGLTADFTDNFDDVKPGVYYYDAVGIAKKLGIAAGSGTNRFNPTESISRQDMVVLAACALEKYKGLKAADNNTVLEKFSDKGDIAEYAANSLAAMVNAGLVEGCENKLNPRSSVTRAEVTVFLYNIYNKYPEAQVIAAPTLLRFAGQSNIETALTVAKATYPDKASNAVLATADNYPDALAGSVLAYQLDAPILLVGSLEADQEKVIDYLKSNLEPEGTVYILGGTAVVPSRIEEKIQNSGFNHITRIAGETRYDTAVKIAEQLKVKTGTPVVLVSGENYPDALAVSSIAAQNQFPILLVQKDGIDEAVSQEIAAIKPNKIYIIGLQGAISPAVEIQAARLTNLAAEDIVRIGGADCFTTSLAVAEYFNLGSQTVCIATGNNFSDALAGSVYAAKYKAPIILTDKNLPEEIMEYLESRKPAEMVIFGGEAVVGKEIEQMLRELADV